MGRTPNGARIKTSLDSSSDQYPSHQRPPAFESLNMGLQVSLLNHDGSNLGRARKNKHSLRSHLSVWDRTDAIRLDTCQIYDISLFLEFEGKSEKTILEDQ